MKVVNDVAQIMKAHALLKRQNIIVEFSGKDQILMLDQMRVT